MSCTGVPSASDPFPTKNFIAQLCNFDARLCDRQQPEGMPNIRCLNNRCSHMVAHVKQLHSDHIRTDTHRQAMKKMRYRYLNTMFALAMSVAFTGSVSAASLLIHLQMAEGSGSTTANSGTLGGDGRCAERTGMGRWRRSRGEWQFHLVWHGAGHRLQHRHLVWLTLNGLDNRTQYTMTTWFKLNDKFRCTQNPLGLFTTRDVDGASNGSQQWWITDIRFTVLDERGKLALIA
jgi:hypothetical protein